MEVHDSTLICLITVMVYSTFFTLAVKLGVVAVISLFNESKYFLVTVISEP